MTERFCATVFKYRVTSGIWVVQVCVDYLRISHIGPLGVGSCEGGTFFGQPQLCSYPYGTEDLTRGALRLGCHTASLHLCIIDLFI